MSKPTAVEAALRMVIDSFYSEQFNDEQVGYIAGLVIKIWGEDVHEEVKRRLSSGQLFEENQTND